MKAETAIIKINGQSSLKVLLLPETEVEREFLEKAKNECANYAVSYENKVRDAPETEPT